MNNLFKNAINFYENKEYDKAKKVCEDILDIQPDDLNATNLLAILNFHNKDFVQSIKFFEKAIEINPNISETYNNLGNVLKELGKHEEAKDCFLKSIKLLISINRSPLFAPQSTITSFNSNFMFSKQ